MFEDDENQTGSDSNNQNNDNKNGQNNNQNQDNDSEYVSQFNALINKKTQLKTQYNQDLKVLNDQIALLMQQRSDLKNAENKTEEQIQANKLKSLEINASINDKVNKKLVKKTTYQQNVKNIEQQLVILNGKIAEEGGDVDVKCIDESVKSQMRFSRKLYEAVLNRTDEMFAAISMAFDNIENLSYKPDKTKCRTFAKNIIAYLNRLGWGSENHENEFKDFMIKLINASHVSLAKNEKEKFIENLISLMKESTLFMWVFSK